jgi:hypothetical protein
MATRRRFVISAACAADALAGTESIASASRNNRSDAPGALLTERASVRLSCQSAARPHRRDGVGERPKVTNPRAAAARVLLVKPR